ncbi:MAG: pyruvate kinase [Candidatus Woesearchaeota archaeon]
MEKHFTARKTKIVCTLGPSSNTREMIKKLHEKGMDIARLNFSHSTHEDHQKFIDHIHAINEELEIPIGLMLDTKGPEIRIGVFESPITLKDNEEVVLTTEKLEFSTEKIIEVSYKNLPKIVEKGSFIYIADGTVELRVEEVRGTEIICKVNIGGDIGTRKNVNVPGSIVDLPGVSEQDISDIEFGIKNNIDFIAQSFVKTPEDVLEVRELLKKHDAEHIHIIAKIESFQALQCLDEIIKVSDGIMVARGDLGVQIPIEDIPEVQKRIIRKCNIAGKPVITATQMLESMTKNPRPTRAEATDVANAILDGTDAIMLSGETASGKHPLRAIDIMDKIARRTERTLHFMKLYPWADTEKDHQPTIVDSMSRSVCRTARDLQAAAIVTCTVTGNTARQISSHRPLTPIFAVTPSEKEYRKLILSWGVRPVRITMPENTDELISTALNVIKEKGLVESFDVVVITASIPFNSQGSINMMKVEMIK